MCPGKECAAWLIGRTEAESLKTSVKSSLLLQRIRCQHFCKQKLLTLYIVAKSFHVWYSWQTKVEHDSVYRMSVCVFKTAQLHDSDHLREKSCKLGVYFTSLASVTTSTLREVWLHCDTLKGYIFVISYKSKFNPISPETLTCHGHGMGVNDVVAGELLRFSALPIPAGWQARCTPQPGPFPAKPPSRGASHAHLRGRTHTHKAIVKL